MSGGTAGGPLVSVRDLRKIFPSRRRGGAGVRAVDGVSFDIAAGSTFGLVGESGCGKTTTGRLVLRLLDATSGSIRFERRELTALSPAELRAFRRDAQIVFQDPMSSLNPRMSVGELIAEPLVVHRIGTHRERRERLARLLDLVGLQPAHAGRFAHEFSGGQRQRIAIARALALEPKLIVCDEAVSALDVSIQAQILNLLMDLRDELGLTYLFISHDLGVVRHLSDRVAVMYLGEIVEIASKRALFERPSHPYTQVLMRAIPRIADGRRRFETIPGDVPSPSAPPAGCRFHTRCPHVMDICRKVAPPMVTAGPDHAAACHLLTEPVGADRALAPAGGPAA